MFFWRKNPFGFILSAGNEQDPNLFVLSYSDYKSQDTSFIELTYADRPSIISIPILDKNQGWGKWKNIKLYFEKENKEWDCHFKIKILYGIKRITYFMIECNLILVLHHLLLSHQGWQ